MKSSFALLLALLSGFVSACAPANIVASKWESSLGNSP